MDIIQYQLPAVGGGDAVDAVAPIQIHQLHYAILDRQLHPPGLGDAEGGEGQQARHGLAVGLV